MNGVDEKENLWSGGRKIEKTKKLSIKKLFLLRGFAKRKVTYVAKYIYISVLYSFSWNRMC